MKYAIVKNDIVVNIAIAEAPIDESWIEIPNGVIVNRGNTWDGTVFTKTLTYKAKFIGMGILSELLTDTTLLELDDIKNDIGQPQLKREAVKRILTRINSNTEVDVNHDDFSTLLTKLVNNLDSLSGTEAIEILNNLQNR